MHILLLDPEELTRIQTASALRVKGHIVHEAECEEEALGLTLTFPVDVLVTEGHRRAPQYDGELRDFALLMRETRRHLPIIGYCRAEPGFWGKFRWDDNFSHIRKMDPGALTNLVFAVERLSIRQPA